MRYYFFITSMQDRGKGPQPTLRALPGQTFPDGTSVNPDYNVQAPKEPGTSANGCRQEYPTGTKFCSTFLEEVTTANGVKFYTVYDTANGQGPGQNDPDFHPVSTDPAFQYVNPGHESKKMNVALVTFEAFGEQTDGTEDEPAPATAPAQAKGERFNPADNKGKARPVIAGWAPAYEDEVETEAELIVTWMRRLLTEMGIRTMARRPKVDAASLKKFSELYSCGETVDTIASRTRFNRIFVEQKMDAAGLSTLSKGPLDWYLDELLSEHANALTCTASTRNADDPTEVKDAAFIVTTELNKQLGTVENPEDPAILADMKKALEDGWSLDDIMEPEILTSQGSVAALTSALATGRIPRPVRNSTGGGKSLIDTLMKNPKNARPKDKDGFHVDEMTWKILVRNLHKKVNTLLCGPTGCGKTEVIKRLCDQTGTPYTIIPMGTITDPTEQLVGKLDLDPATNGTKYDWADFALAIQRPGVIILDELNRIPRNGENLLFSVLDGTRTLVASGAKSTDKRTIQVNPDCVFFATANIGSDYTGTKELDLALANRFFLTELDYLDVKTETAILCSRTGIGKEDATNIATIATNIRKSYKSNQLEHSVSTRETLQCAGFVKDGFSVEESLEICFLPLFEGGMTDKDPNCERGTVRAMIASRFNSK